MLTFATYRKAVVLFGVLHILFCVTGLYVVFVTLRSVSFLQDDASAPRVVESFYTMTGFNVLLMISIGWAGYRLLRSGVSAVTFSNLVCFGEIVYLLVFPLLPLLPRLGTSIGPAIGLGNVAIMAQRVVLYPVIAVIGLSYCRRGLFRRAERALAD